MGLRAVKSAPMTSGAPGARAAAFLIVDAEGLVTTIEGWETLAIDVPPTSLAPNGDYDSPLPRGLAALAAAARTSNRPEAEVFEVTTDREHFYAAVASPLPGPGRATRVALSVTETDPPQATDAEGRIIRQLGHDLRTPLTSISGGVELMQSGRLGGLQPQQERILGLMAKGVESMARQIDEATAPYRKHKDLLAALGDDAAELLGGDGNGGDPRKGGKR
ncbi:MAG TPA: histidine kinase dimerization/phospho-acceptor domain-containing protein [Candidatus Polarisedimenticolia bacterium]|nr:histidine kinase dimerization/phospho-acceptor domain-containing protein [Candidatus Polarisedimenticolia bacterium]